MFTAGIQTFDALNTQVLTLQNASLITDAILDLKFAKIHINFIEINIVLISTAGRISFRRFNKLKCTQFTGIFDKTSQKITLVPSRVAGSGCYSGPLTGEETVFVLLHQQTTEYVTLVEKQFKLKEIVSTTTDFAHYSSYYTNISLDVDPNAFLQEDFTNFDLQTVIQQTVNGELTNQTINTEIHNLVQNQTEDCFSSSNLDFFESYLLFTALPGAMKQCTTDIIADGDQVQVTIQISETGDLTKFISLTLGGIITRGKQFQVMYNYSADFLANISILKQNAIFIVDLKPIEEYEVTDKIRLFPVVWKQVVTNVAVYLVDTKFCIRSGGFGQEVVKIQATIATAGGTETISFRGSVVAQYPDVICTKTDLVFEEGAQVKLFIDDQEVRNAKLEVLDCETLGWSFWVVFAAVLVVFAGVVSVFAKKKMI